MTILTALVSTFLKTFSFELEFSKMPLATFRIKSWNRTGPLVIEKKESRESELIRCNQLTGSCPQCSTLLHSHYCSTLGLTTQRTASPAHSCCCCCEWTVPLASFRLKWSRIWALHKFYSIHMAGIRFSDSAKIYSFLLPTALFKGHDHPTPKVVTLALRKKTKLKPSIHDISERTQSNFNSV